MKKEFWRIIKSKMLMATLVAVVILPLIYGGLYLWAFWDPYGKMENLPVAIVNNDKCAYKSDKKDKKQYCFGQELIDKLKDERAMNWQFVDGDTATEGLRNKKYYTMAVIPNDFSKNILSVDGDSPEKAQIEFKSRQASSFMASKFTDTAFVKIKAALNEKISKEYFDNIFSETRDSLKDLRKAVDGASDLEDGLKKAVDGSTDLYDGIDKENSGIYDLKNGLIDLYNGSERLNNGANSLNNGLSTLSNGTSQTIMAVSSLNAGQAMVIAQLNAYIQAHPEATTSMELMTAMGAANQVNGGLLQLKGALYSFDTGVSQLKGGANDLATGSASLKENLDKAKNGGSDLLSGIEKIKSGQKDLGEGLADAYDGAKELKDKLGEAVDKSAKKTDENKNKIQEEVLAAPVDIHDVSIDIVINNGTGFAPYFIPLALWVGAMAIFFLIDLEFDKKSKIKDFLPKLGVSLVVATLQTITLDLVLTKLLGLKVNHYLSFVLFTLVLAYSSTLIQMFLTLSMEMAGKFVGIVLLMLQLTSSAGSYPLETAPQFFQKINPLLPMTYAVSALREIISGSNYKIINTDFKVIFIYCLVFLTLIWIYLLKKFKILSVKNIKKWQFLPIKKEK